MNNKGQANIIAVIGMILAVIFALLNLFNYVNNLGLASQIYIQSQNSIYQVLGEKDYMVQQATYLFDKAQLFDGFSLAPTVNCGYISTNTSLPQIPIPNIYYWRNAQGQICLPDNSEIVYGLLNLLEQPSFSTVTNINSSELQEYITLNMTYSSNTGKYNVYESAFSAPFLSQGYIIKLNESFGNVENVSVYKDVGGNPGQFVFSGGTDSTFNLSNYTFKVGSVTSAVSGILNRPSSLSSFFSGSGVSPNSQYYLVTLQNGQLGIVYSNEVSNTYHFNIALLPNPYVSSLADTTVIPLLNASASNEIDGTEYTFVITNDTNGLFVLYPSKYMLFNLDPQFVVYKYLLNSFQTAGPVNLLYGPTSSDLSVSFSLYPLYNPQVCVSKAEYGFSLNDCLTLASSVFTQDYLSNLLQLGIAFVNQTFPIGSTSIQGFPQFELYNYLENVIQGVNMKTVSVDGQPKYDWYSSLIFAIGSPKGVNYLENAISCAKQPEFGTYIYNCGVSQSCLSTCRSVLNQVLTYSIENLLNYQVPTEVSFLSATPFDVNVVNISVKAAETDACPSNGNYYSSFNYTYSPSSVSSAENTSEVLGVPVSLIFGYQNKLNLTPTESCGIQASPHNYCAPGFYQTLTPSLNCCSPIIANKFLNTTCFANLQTTDQSVEQYINNTPGDSAYKGCIKTVINTNPQKTILYTCNHYSFTNFNYADWILNNNQCPNYVVVDGKNFTKPAYTSGGSVSSFYLNNPYIDSASYGGGSINEVITPGNWTYVLYNSSLLSKNLSFSVGVYLGGAKPSLNIILNSSNSPMKFSPSDSFMFESFSGYSGQATLYNYSGTGSKVLSVGSANYNPEFNLLELNKYCVGGTCLINGYSNYNLVNSFPYQESAKSGTGLLGVSTDGIPTNDSIAYMFAQNYYPNYIPHITISGYQTASNLNPSLVSAFGFQSNNFVNTFFNQIAISNPKSFGSSYSGSITLTNQFNFNYLNYNDLEVFGAYPSGKVVQLSWWNQTPIFSVGPNGQYTGGDIWVNMTDSVPPTLYFVYGENVTYNQKYDYNGSAVFPFFFMPNSSSDTITNYSTALVNAPYFSSLGLVMVDNSSIPPSIYHISPTRLYGQFACITNGATTATLVNGSYLFSSNALNLQNLYIYNPIYPDFELVGEETVSLLQSTSTSPPPSQQVTTVFTSNLPSTAEWKMTYGSYTASSTSSSISFTTAPGYYQFTASDGCVFPSPNTCTDSYYTKVYSPTPTSGYLEAGSSQNIKYALSSSSCMITSEILRTC
ncbi:hypothetical protein IHE50_00990 [Candidatus Parvarchaeota archaeon]|uniref:Uncharacterized protein n=1 Tax=Candidatus Acidifodinimicrobium mancum TaxID=2898728 RepID=A0A8T3UTW5_9ARCH|nr:hypothetical protein [Candidatus Acidifodinimicrobium mancum]